MFERLSSGVAVTFTLLVLSNPASAAEAALNGADTAWILTSTALVLFMTLPGLALFYGGLVRANNVLSVLMHCFAIACLASILWLIGGYALAFGDGGSLQAWIGGAEKWFLLGIGPNVLSGSIPEILFVMFQMTFAIITPALIVGAYVERIKFSAVMVFSGLWLFLVYAPVCHWVWGGGWLAGLGVMDFAGGIVVHVTAGSSALLLAKMLGGRRGFPKDLRPPHNPGMTMIGAAMLWVGWFGFNAGSALAANGSASMAMLVTHISAAAGALTWAILEQWRFGKSSLIGIVTGMVAGLATITPASGFVGPLGALCIGVTAGVVCHFAVGWVKQKIQIDDSLDVFAVHGVGGGLGTLLTAFFAAASLGGVGLAEGTSMGQQFGVQLIGVVAVLVWSVAISYIIVKAVDTMVGLRVEEEDEIVGLDLIAHGERGYDL
ncbi:MAG: ammonium transporter [Proteobacteria bacterium]|nr:ammonium transporter [Pseudomonadota bacterium]